MTLYLCGLMISFFMSYQLNFFNDQTESAKIARAIVTGFTWPLLLSMLVATTAVVCFAVILDKVSDFLSDTIDELT